MSETSAAALTAQSPKVRDLTIDEFRGLAIFMMFPVNYMEHVRAVPAWLKHAPDVGITVADFVAPFFIFAIGFTTHAALEKRLVQDKKNGVETFEYVIRRSMALIGIGALFTIGETSQGFDPKGWGTLQAIGASIALAAPTAWLSARARLVLALLLMLVWQWALDALWLHETVRSSHAGIKGSLSWTALLILATVFAEAHKRREKSRVIAGGALLLAAGIALSPWVPVSKHRMSLSFDLIVSGSSALVFSAMAWLAALRKGHSALLVRWGQNPLAMYVSHLFLLAVFIVPRARWWHYEAGLAQAFVQGVAFMAVLDLWSRFLQRRQWLISI